MKLQKQYASKLVAKISQLSKAVDRDVYLMEVCGTHTQSISKFGIRSVLPKNIHLTTGPGCPICVMPQKEIDSIVNIALEGVPIATYGDALRVPGYFGSLEDARKKGAKVFTVYSVEEALLLQKQYPRLVFFGYGFETTTPMTAIAVKKGLTVYSAHRLFLPAMQALLKNKDTRIDGFISPGHVSAIVGLSTYRSMKVPQVITGFEQHDILFAIYKLLKQILENRATVENEYTRVVKEQGNQKAFALIFEIFEKSDSEWRGLGQIPHSGLNLKKKYQSQDAKLIYKNTLSKIDFSKALKPSACQCEKVVLGIKAPWDCPLFSKVCTPENPQGACMVSVEGACSVHFKYNSK